jgi:hypothetical protein
MRQRITLALIFVAAALGTTGCHRAVESRVKSLDAKIDGLTCPTCVPPLHKSLKAQYGNSTVDVDDDRDSARITFADGEQFTPGAFKAAVERVRMHVVALRVQACGTVETTGGKQWLTAGPNRFLIHSDRDVPNQPICADGTLDARSDPATYQVSAFTLQSASGS